MLWKALLALLQLRQTLRDCTHNLFEVSYATLTWNMYEQWNKGVKYVLHQNERHDMICVGFGSVSYRMKANISTYSTYSWNYPYQLMFECEENKLMLMMMMVGKETRRNKKRTHHQPKKIHVNRKISILCSWKYVKAQLEVSVAECQCLRLHTEQQLHFIFLSLHIHITAYLSLCERWCTHISTTCEALDSR